MLVALTLGVAINAVLPDLSFAGAENAIASAISAQPPTKLEAHRGITITLFVIIILITLGIVIWAAKRTKTTADFYAARGAITGLQNGWAIAGDYMSAASFLGIAGLICLYGYDGFMYSVGWWHMLPSC